MVELLWMVSDAMGICVVLVLGSGALTAVIHTHCRADFVCVCVLEVWLLKQLLLKSLIKTASRNNTKLQDTHWLLQ